MFKFIQKTSLLFLLIAVNCTVDDSEPKELLAGQWIMTEITHDGESQPAWNGTELTFQQLDLKGGSYSVPNTLYDSILHSSGSWEKINQPNALILNGNLAVSYTMPNNDQLIISFLLPEMHTCEEPPCILEVNGNWVFKFTRK
jgi:hypothetical protein